MYILPNTTVKLFKNCPLDKSYENTILFASASAQTTFFASLTGYTFSAQTYQRVHSNKIRVAMNAEPLYNCNYLAFQNASFGTKWFYAFVLSVEYINNTTSEITYQIDVLQTWHFDYVLRQCLVEREHTTTDNVGDNLLPENLELGEYITDDFDGTNNLAPKVIVVAATFDADYRPISGTIYSGIFSGLYYHVYPNTTAGAVACAAFIANAGAASSGIVSVFLMPESMVTNMLDPAKSYTISKTKKTSGAIDGYTPRNKKLYTYPYNFLYVTNMQGNAAVFPYEYFTGTSCAFLLAGDMSPNPSVVMAPINYKGVSNDFPNYDEKMVLSGYPQLGFNVDTYRAWLAQNASTLALNALSSGMTLAGGIAAENPVVAAQGITGALSVVNQVYQHSIMPHQAKGGAGSTTNCAIGLQDFMFMHKHIRGEFAHIIDDYFDMFGYACHRVKIPNRNARPEWTYVKTIGCKIDPAATSGLPGDDMEMIENLYNNGIRWWNNPAHIGNYTYSNAPVTPGG